MVRRYVTAVAYARKYNVKSAPIGKGLARLAYYTDLIGDAKLEAYVTRTPDPNAKGTSMLTYTPNMYVKARPGL